MKHDEYSPFPYFSNEELASIKTVVSHDNCADGLMSVLVLKEVLPNLENIHMLTYGPSQLALPATEGMLFCDMTPHPNRAKEFRDVGAYILDHHKGAEMLVRSFGDRGVFADEKEAPGVSGVYLAACAVRHQFTQFSLVDKQPRWLVQTISARDTFDKRDMEKFIEGSKTSDVLHFFGTDSWEDVEIDDHVWRERMALRDILWSKRQRSLEKAAEEIVRLPCTHPTTGEPAVFGVTSRMDLVSDLNEVSGCDALVGFRYDFDKETNSTAMTLSFRAKSPRMGILDLAKKLGGGGHTLACGARVEDVVNGPYDFVKTMLEIYY